MILPLQWLKIYADIDDITASEFAHRMTMVGNKVEGYTCEAENIRNIVAGKVVSIKRNKIYENLYVCSVFLGQGIVQIVTSAKNLREGDIVPVALDGARLPSGKEIEACEIQGIKSEGMMCSLAELGLSKNDFPECVEDGIMKLPLKTEIGADIIKVLGLDDVVFEFEITPNRPDCLCISGLAREAAVAFGADFKLPRPKVTKSHGHIADSLSVQNDTPDNCLRYSGALVENVRVRPSPRWIREKLRRCGVRPVNNIVDITNYVMLEYNQPMHAFDYAKIKNKKIIIRQATKGEKITTLDDVKQKLTSDMMVIADTEKALAVAGVMGGAESSVTSETKSIVFESACFNADSVRRTSKALGLRTESSLRFEKGLDPFGTEPAIIRALELVEQLDAGDIVKGIVDAKGKIVAPSVIELDPDYVNDFLGTDISRGFMISTLKRLGCAVDEELHVTPPTFRADIECQADLAEEIARFYGYDRIVSTGMRGVAAARPTERQRFDDVAIEVCTASGLYEINTSSFMGAKSLDMLGVTDNDRLRKTVVIENPLGEDTSFMRSTAIPGMMETIARNYNLRIPSVGFFELAKEFMPAAAGKLPVERNKLIIGMYGKKDFFIIKGIVELLAERAHIGSLKFDKLVGYPHFHPGRAASVFAKGKQIGVIGELNPIVVDNYGVSGRVVIANIDLDATFAQISQVKYKPLPKFPAITRDLALVCDIDTQSATMEHAIREGCGDILEDVTVFDVYTGDKVKEGKKSIAYSIVLRDSAKTLTDKEADEAIGRTLGFLKMVGIELRQ